MSLTHKQRIENALSLKSSDRIPYSMWMHFPNRDRHPRRLAELSVLYQKKYDLDFIKFMPYGMYSTVDYGTDLDVFNNFFEPPVQHKPIIQDAADLEKIVRPVCGRSGEYAVVLEAQRLLAGMLTERVPVVQTIFSPLTTIAKMCDVKTVLRLIEQAPQAVHRALELITETTVRFARASVEIGADGFFLATQLSSRDMLTPALHDEFVKRYDMAILAAVQGDTWFNIMHLHGANVYIDQVQDYPVQALSWHDRDDGPSMEEVRAYSDKAFVGGLSWGTNWLKKSTAEIMAEVGEVASRFDGCGTIMGPGCVIEPTTPPSFLDTVHTAVLQTTGK